MKFNKLAQLYEKLENMSSHNTMRDTLATFFKKTPTADVDKVAYLTLGQISSQYSDVLMGMAAKMVVKSIAQAANEKEADITKEYKKKGDIGTVAEAHAKGKSTLTIKEAFDTLHQIAEASGTGSQDKKIKLLAELLKKSSPLEARYLARIVVGDLRMGVGDKTVLDALSIAKLGSKQAKNALEHAYNICPDVGKIATVFFKKGLKGVDNIGVELGVPLQSMLCQRIDSLDAVKKKMGYPVAVEEKYDGERIQVHKQGSKIRLFSRRLDDITHQFPDVAAAVKKAAKKKNCVIDGEAMPVDKDGNYLPFQKLMQRRRKHDVEKYVKKIPVIFFVFDLLYDGKSLIKEPYKKRWNKLTKAVKQTSTLKLANRKECNDADCIEELFTQTIQKGGEGVVIKNLEGPYQAGVRGWHWIKWKPEYAEKLRDTFDLVVVGAYHGRGKRAGTYGALLCAVYDKKNDRFQTFCKLGSGFTDKQLAELPKKFKKKTKKPARVEVKKAMNPDVWLEPDTVVEVIGAEITKSPIHTAKYALRFPRFKRYRDKKPEQATTLKEITRMAT